MPTDAGDALALERRVTDFLTRNFPQIRMHGGSASVEVDPGTGEVTVRLGGACSGCGVSPMTARAITSRLPEAIPEVEAVDAGTADADAGSAEEGTVPLIGGEDVEAPF